MAKKSENGANGSTEPTSAKKKKRAEKPKTNGADKPKPVRPAKPPKPIVPTSDGRLPSDKVVVLGEELSITDRIKKFFLEDSEKKFNRKQFRSEIEEIFERRGIGQVSEQIFRIVMNSLMFKGIPVRNIMIDDFDVTHLDAGADLKTVVETAMNCGHSRIPVTVRENGSLKVEGILYVKDLMKYIVRKPKTFQIRKIIRSPFVIPDTFPIDRLLEEFRLRRMHLAIVVNELGDFVGLVTMEDVTEEILGEFEDEFDKEEKLIRKLDDGTIEMEGRLSIRDLNKYFDQDFPEDSHRTLGGLIWHAFGSRPGIGDSITLNGFRFQIKSLRRKTIGKLTVTLPEGEQANHDIQ